MVNHEHSCGRASAQSPRRISDSRILEDGTRLGEETPLLPARPSRPTCIKTALGVASILLITFSGGGVNIFSLYTRRLVRDLGFTQYHVGMVSTFMMGSLYTLIPVFGRVCQLTSLRFLSLLSTSLFGVAYLVLAGIFSQFSGPDNGPPDLFISFPVSVGAFASLGAATAGVLIVSMTACAEMFEESSAKGLLMSIPITSIGLSGVIHASIAGAFLHNSATSDATDIVWLFLFLAIFLSVVGGLGSYGLEQAGEQSEETPVLAPESCNGITGRVGHVGHSSCLVVSREPDDEGSAGLDGLVPCPAVGEASPRANPDHVAGLLGDSVLWYLAVANLLLQGACESYNINLGSLIQSTLEDTSLRSSPEEVIRQHVTVLAISSTLSRILAGLLFDMISPNGALIRKASLLDFFSSLLRSPMIVFLVFCTFGGAGFAFLWSTPVDTRRVLPLVTSLIGIAYGASSTLGPLATLIWSPYQFPVAYGIVNMAPAIGIGLQNFLFSYEYEKGGYMSGDYEVQCFGSACYATWAQGGTASCLLAMMFVLGAWWTLRPRITAA